MPVREHLVSYRNGPQVMVAGLSLKDMGYCRGAHVRVSDLSENPANAPWVFVVSNDEHATLVCRNPGPPPWVQPGVRIRIEVKPAFTGTDNQPDVREEESPPPTIEPSSGLPSSGLGKEISLLHQQTLVLRPLKTMGADVLPHRTLKAECSGALERLTLMVRPLVVHADWGTAAGKRWYSTARWDGRRYWIEVPELVGPLSEFVPGVLDDVDSQAALIGFDFPIGVPQAYAEKVGVSAFLEFLKGLGCIPYEQFFEVACTAEQISVLRPFYPYRPGGTSQVQLLKGLGLTSIAELLRQCERASADRGPASPLFWTLGAKQVGKAAICGWRDVIRPALLDYPDQVALWPFEGRLDSLLQPGRCVITETYPAEACVQLGLPAPGNGWSKARQADRIAKGAVVAERLQEYDVMISRTARCALKNGFGPGTDGEDQFDSFVGLAAMLGVLLGFRSEGFPADPAVQSVEGWILGQGPLQVAVNGRRDS